MFSHSMTRLLCWREATKRWIQWERLTATCLSFCHLKVLLLYSELWGTPLYYWNQTAVTSIGTIWNTGPSKSETNQLAGTFFCFNGKYWKQISLMLKSVVYCSIAVPLIPKEKWVAWFETGSQTKDWSFILWQELWTALGSELGVAWLGLLALPTI